MTARSFIDTNVLFYADDSRYPGKQLQAIDLISTLRREWRGVLSHQVLHEYFHAATRKLGLGVPLARQRVEFYARLEVVQPSLDITLRAIDRHQADKLPLWDALIVEAALVSGCAVLYSEDMQAGRRFGALQVVNPFA